MLLQLWFILKTVKMFNSLSYVSSNVSYVLEGERHGVIVTISACRSGGMQFKSCLRRNFLRGFFFFRLYQSRTLEMIKLFVVVQIAHSLFFRNPILLFLSWENYSQETYICLSNKNRLHLKAR